MIPYLQLYEYFCQAPLGCIPGGTEVEHFGSFHNEVGERRHLRGAGDAIMDVMRETDAQFGSGRRQRHECVPGRGALAGVQIRRARWQWHTLHPGGVNDLLKGGAVFSVSVMDEVLAG